MAISDQIGRLTTLRNNIRSKLINLGILPAASTSATLSECYNVLSSVTGLSAMSYTPTTTAQTIASGQYLKGAQTINAIPSTYIVPTGTSTVTSNSVYDIRQYASVSVNVQPVLQSKTVTPTQDVQSVTPDTGIYGLSKVTVNAIPSSYLIPSGTIILSSSGTFDVGSYASADVTVTGQDSRVKLLINTTSNGSRRTIANISYALFSEFSKIANCAFLGFGGFDSIINSSIFENVEYIGSFAFAGLADFFPSSAENTNFNRIFSKVKIIDNGAFAYCRGYNKVNLFLPNCENVSMSAFACSPINSSELGERNITEPFWSAMNSALTGINLPKCETIGSGAFCAQYRVSAISLPMCTDIKQYAFQRVLDLSNDVYLPECISIGSYAFQGAGYSSWSAIFSAPKCKYIGYSAFAQTNYTGQGLIRVLAFKSFYFDAIEELSQNYIFNYCGFRTISMPILNLISATNTFNLCTKADAFSFPALTTISGGNNWQSCTALTTVSFPALTTISGGYNWSGCTALTTVSFPALTTISGLYIFNKCSSLCSICLPVYSYTSLITGMFDGCWHLSLASFPATSRLSGAYMFRSCYNLISMFLLGSSVCQLGNTIVSMFGSTPVSTYSTSAWRNASIYVPQSLLASYKAATNWTTVSSKIFAYESYFGTIGSFGYVNPAWTPVYSSTLNCRYASGNGYFNGTTTAMSSLFSVDIANQAYTYTIEYDGDVYPCAGPSSIGTSITALNYGAPRKVSSFYFDYIPFALTTSSATIGGMATSVDYYFVAKTSGTHTVKIYKQLP